MQPKCKDYLWNRIIGINNRIDPRLWIASWEQNEKKYCKANVFNFVWETKSFNRGMCVNLLTSLQVWFLIFTLVYEYYSSLNIFQSGVAPEAVLFYCSSLIYARISVFDAKLNIHTVEKLLENVILFAERRICCS